MGVVFISKLRPNLQQTISNLQKALPYVQFPKNEAGDSFLYVYPQRLHRRAWRTCYLKSPVIYKKAQRHYVFHDWRYQFTFKHLPLEGPTANQVVSACLGSMEGDVNCVAEFNWCNDRVKGDLLDVQRRLLDANKSLEKHQKSGHYAATLHWRPWSAAGNQWGHWMP